MGIGLAAIVTATLEWVWTAAAVALVLLAATAAAPSGERAKLALPAVATTLVAILGAAARIAA